MTVNFVTVSLKQLSLSQLTKILTATLLPVDIRIMMGELELVVLTNYGYVFLSWFVFERFSTSWHYKMPRAHLVCFLPQSWIQLFLQGGLLLKNKR